MSPFSVKHYPVFESGIFRKNPDLFDQFTQGIPEYLKNQYRERQKELYAYEGKITWAEVAGSGFCAATHPGAGNIFTATLIGSNNYIYDSDCLFLDLSRRIFAVADPPGATIFARRLFEEMERYLETHPVDDLEVMLNKINGETRRGESATLSLVCFPEDRKNALVLVAGDTYLFQGNIVRKKIKRIEGIPNLIGTIYTQIQLQSIRLEKGDFFIIASDGIFPLRENGVGLEEALLREASGDMDKFAANVIKKCNGVFRERVGDKVIARFNSCDNVTALLVYPEKLAGSGEKGSLILGGYVDKVK